jgi:type IV secretion system protein VirB9
MPAVKNIIMIITLLMASSSFASSLPITIDSRIKTLVYSENEVFRVVIHVGYQTVIEFAKNENIQTMSVGNNYAWQLNPLDNRLFIKPLEENILTNMTIITNYRTYQLELQSKSSSLARDDELAYVVRFFYPDTDSDSIEPDLKLSIPNDLLQIEKPFNYNYTLTGPDSIAPIEVFDDGLGTFFKFDDKKTSTPPRFQVKDGKQLIDLMPVIQGKYIYINVISKEFVVSNKKQTVNVYNEEMR